MTKRNYSLKREGGRTGVHAARHLDGAPRSRRVVCKFPSLKLGRTVHVGSLLVRDLLYLLDFDPQVESYTETTPHISYVHSNKSLVFTFDLLIKRDGVTQLAKAVSKNKPFDTQAQLHRSVGFACRRAGYEFVIFTEETVRAQPRLTNLKILTRYARLQITPQHRLACHRFFLSGQSMRVGELTAFFSSEGLEPSVQAVYDILEVRIAENNRFRAPEDRLPIPHRNSLYDHVSKIDPYERDAARLGKRYADQRWRQNKIGVRATRPLERVEIDHTKIDLFVVDMEHRLPIGRPWVTTAIDTFSRMIVGFYISFAPPSALSVMRCLRHAIARKTYLREKYPNVEHSWKAYGIPEEIVPDHGMEFLGRDFEDACLQLGIIIDYCPVKKPWLKPMIENFFAVQNRKLLHRTPGTTFSNIFDKGDYDSSKHAVVSFDALQEMLHLWIVDIYSQSEHRGLHGIPAQVWREGVARFQPALPSSLKELHILLGQVEHKKITSGGIELFGLRYNVDDLSRVRRELGKEKALIKYDANDLSLVYVADCKTYRYVSVPALDQEYTRGLTLWQHKLIRRFAREQLKLRLDLDGLRRAKAKLQALVEQEWALTKRRSSTRVRMARYLNLNSATGGAVEEPAASPLPPLEDKSAPVGLLPASDIWSGVSNIAAHVVETPTTEAGVPELHLVSPMQVSATPPVKRKRRGGSKERKAAIPAVAPVGDAGDRSIEVELQAEDLDLEGWSVDFNLPR